eukprot:TRINITY_DN71285_c0_g1_i1.p1 TRINITY_DN71285_c0_g1~~TRINITY_DN71285_c0_g1_i1.p1  ORF type:complete len:374 (+),score=123.76 TRINITY_DN71285_c0_g1_i1:102-1223(+)
MALAQNVQIARDKFLSQTEQAQLHGRVAEQAQVQAELHRSQASQRAVEATLGQQQAVHGQEIAAAQNLWETQEFEEKKIAVLLQGFTALSKIFHNITYTAAIIMGFSASMFVKEKISNTPKTMKFIFWGLAMITIILFIHSVFVASLAITDGTKLAYQGTRGLEDVKRAFHGLMARRSEIFWNYMAGFISFLLFLIYAIWMKLDQTQGPGGSITTGGFFFGGTLSLVAWFVPLVRMVIAFRSTRSAFKIDYDFATEDFSDALGPERLVLGLDMHDPFARALGPQSLRRLEDARERGGVQGRGSASPRRRRQSSVDGAADMASGASSAPPHRSASPSARPGGPTAGYCASGPAPTAWPPPAPRGPGVPSSEVLN